MDFPDEQAVTNNPSDDKQQTASFKNFASINQS